MILNWNFERWRTRDRLLDFEQNSGYFGSLSDFWNMVEEGKIITGTVDTFPTEGIDGMLYLDIETSKLYYYTISAGTYLPVASTAG